MEGPTRLERPHALQILAFEKEPERRVRGALAFVLGERFWWPGAPAGRGRAPDDGADDDAALTGSGTSEHRHAVGGMA